ncbi:uncharacterized protein F4822DRAFT_145843 [Hypoxylon trugodes]|uniref:uncharacterized protein n=1 Tax=Hypoxylon trugodes TaxID=326681 RepID=UPI00219DFE9C|nr:uncharacterized protein F4822DRAFT_145843 [Hypoxylon trugodes]KAI1392899.1 hypothetical protein F4822DRAFT_145843 [Hypoxylon trugodes]
MDETTKLWYMQASPLYETERPYHIFEPLPPECKPGNLSFELGPPQSIKDVRGHEREYTLQIHGFAFKSRILPNVNWNDETDISTKYIEDLRRALSEVPGLGSDIETCKILDWRIRKSGSENVLENPGADRMVKISPAYIVHIDQSPAGVLHRIRKQFGAEIEALIHGHRVQVINIWRPLVAVVEDLPLALCDARTVSQEDLVETEFINTDDIRRSYMVKYSDSFQFHYLSRMTKDEICIFKVFDSADVETKWVPHAAFNHAVPSPDYAPRESIEVRFLVFSPEP